MQIEHASNMQNDFESWEVRARRTHTHENTIQKRTHENRERIRHTLCAASQNEAINNGLRATAFVSSLALWFGN